ncbi:MAG: acyl carrier protein [Actinobacteria bacterium]|nr:MAG: acyl carrier protein [Actinomycetota bacterium]
MTRDDVLSALRDASVEVLGVEPGAVTEEANFHHDLDADSLDLVELVMVLEERLGVPIPEEELANINTVGQAVDVVLGRLAPTP